jgi:hypothetical protein
MDYTKSDDESDSRGETSPFENYDVEDAIKAVLELGSRLIEETRKSKQHVKHHFRQEWLDQLVARYRERPGKPIIHLSDLPDQVIPTLSPDVRDLLRPYWDKLVNEHGSEWGSKHFRCMWDIMKSGKMSRWSSLHLWRKFEELTGFGVDVLEPYTMAIRAASTGTSRIISNPKLPFNLATPSGVKLFGYRGDVTHDTSALVNHDTSLHRDYKNSILATIGAVPFTTSVIHGNGVDRTNVGVFVTILTSIGGLDNSRKQKYAKNPLPSWVFLTSKETMTSCQRSLWDAEGSPTRDSLKLGQSVSFPTPLEFTIPDGKRRVKASALPRQIQDDLEKTPPLLLVSASLCLYALGIKSYLAPLGLEKTKQGMSAVWMLHVYRTVNMRLFESEIGFLSAEKRDKLSHLNSIHRAKSSLPLSFLKSSCNSPGDETVVFWLVTVGR